MVLRGHWKLILIILVIRDTCGYWNMATCLFLANNDLHLKGGCWPEHYSMPFIKHSKISRSSSLRAFYSIFSLNLPHIQSLVTGQWENGRLIRVGGHLIDRAGMVRQLIQNLPACCITHTHKPVGWASCYVASFRWPRPSQEILFKVVHITKFM